MLHYSKFKKLVPSLITRQPKITRVIRLCGKSLKWVMQMSPSKSYCSWPDLPSWWQSERRRFLFPSFELCIAVGALWIMSLIVDLNSVIMLSVQS